MSNREIMPLRKITINVLAASVPVARAWTDGYSALILEWMKKKSATRLDYAI